jgi:hypothetical protein
MPDNSCSERPTRAPGSREDVGSYVGAYLGAVQLAPAARLLALDTRTERT